MTPFTTTGVRILNDALRTSGSSALGQWLITPGVQAEGSDFVHMAIRAVREFDNFTQDNDPWDEHDCASVNVAGHTLIWKIDCYDPTLTRYSDNAADPALTRRVLTIMLASEY